MKNYGINWEKEKSEQSEEDWKFGASSQPCIAEIPEYLRQDYLPKGECQNIGEEKMDCASRYGLNILESKFNWLLREGKISKENFKWLQDNQYIQNNSIEFSDAFVAINSGTTRGGNSLKAPLEAIRKQGLVPKHLLPQLQTFDEHHNPQRITKKLKDLGKEFTERFIINYEKVYEPEMGGLLTKDFLGVAGFAWTSPINGEYPKSSNPPNHAFMIFKSPKYYAFDNYIDSVDGDFIKKLSSDYDFVDYGYRVFISSESVVKLNWFQKLWK